MKNKCILVFLRQFFRRELPAGVVDGVGLGQDQLGDGYHSVAIVDEAGEDGGQRLRRVQRGVVEQHDAAGLDLGGHTLADGVRVVVLPIQRVPIGNDLKPLRRKGLQVLPLCASSKKLTCKWGVWRVVQARERSKSRGCAQGREVVERWGRMRYTYKQSKNLLHQTIPVALGTDGVCSNNSADLFETMKTTALVQKMLNNDPCLLPARQVLEMATQAGLASQGRAGEAGMLRCVYEEVERIVRRIAPDRR